MSITIDKVLARLESELERAIDTGNVQKKREHLAAIKSLCELALETEVDEEDSLSLARRVSKSTAASNGSGHRVPASFEQAAPVYMPPTQPPPIANAPANPIKDDDANGDSLFDF
ncbi:YwdI family protein [Sutcliffiella horikoshii]|uniref:YwdI family protein n=1 Tax=Sutcliffiella horikoshii TaxID=79883 RepID=UPI00384EC63D